ncbi:MAG: type I phosphomannose isomerase catalytic subunit [Lachnospiraceae bacterium]
MELIFLKPVFKQMIWGGNRLRTDFGYDIPGDNTGECWAIGAHPNGDCEIAEGRYAGKTLSELWRDHRELFGNLPGDRFPLLIKIIDAKNDLSIQVHPDDAYAKEHENGSLGKMECWYILDAQPGQTIVIGHNAKNHEEVRSMIEGHRWSEFIREIPCRKGDFFQINPGTVHAIKGGTLILETQQNSDITYRVYDYDRLQNGKPRQLHVQQSIDVIRAPFHPEDAVTERTSEKVQDAVIETLVTCPRYQVQKTELNGTLTREWEAPFVNLSVLEGEGTIEGKPVKKGVHLIIPYHYGPVEMKGRMMMITSTPVEA